MLDLRRDKNINKNNYNNNTTAAVAATTTTKGSEPLNAMGWPVPLPTFWVYPFICNIHVIYNHY